MQKDLYDILGVSKNSSESEIKKAYRKLAMKYHPDRNKDDSSVEAKFKEIQAAYAVLSNPQKKQAYDQFGHAGIDPNMQGGATGAGGFDFGDGFSDIFSELFGGRGRGRQRSARGADLQYDLTISLEEAVHGKEFKIRVPTSVICAECSGSGAHKDSKPIICGRCQGNGQVTMSQGFISIQQTCPSCGGRGKTISKPCNKCNGNGSYREQKSWSVKIPAGINQDDRIRLPGKGEAGPVGTPAGDLYVRINVKDHPIFERDGVDLYCQAPINIVAASLGGDINIPTLEGEVKIKIPKGTQTGKRFRLRNKGITSTRSSTKGDLYVQVLVETPVNLNKEQEEIMKQLGKSIGSNVSKHSPNENSFLDSVKTFFGINK